MFIPEIQPELIISRFVQNLCKCLFGNLLQIFHLCFCIVQATTCIFFSMPQAIVCESNGWKFFAEKQISSKCGWSFLPRVLYLSKCMMVFYCLGTFTSLWLSLTSKQGKLIINKIYDKDWYLHVSLHSTYFGSIPSFFSVCHSKAVHAQRNKQD